MVSLKKVSDPLLLRPMKPEASEGYQHAAGVEKHECRFLFLLIGVNYAGLLASHPWLYQLGFFLLAILRGLVQGRKKKSKNYL